MEPVVISRSFDIETILIFRLQIPSAAGSDENENEAMNKCGTFTAFVERQDFAESSLRSTRDYLALWLPFGKQGRAVQTQSRGISS